MKRLQILYMQQSTGIQMEYTHDKGKTDSWRKFLSASSSEACSSRDPSFFFLFLFFFFLSPDFFLWRSGMTICLVTEVKLQWATLVPGWETTSVHYSCL